MNRGRHFLLYLNPLPFHSVQHTLFFYNVSLFYHFFFIYLTIIFRWFFYRLILLKRGYFFYANFGNLWQWQWENLQNIEFGVFLREPPRKGSAIPKEGRRSVEKYLSLQKGENSLWCVCGYCPSLHLMDFSNLNYFCQ